MKRSDVLKRIEAAQDCIEFAEQAVSECIDEINTANAQKMNSFSDDIATDFDAKIKSAKRSLDSIIGDSATKKQKIDRQQFAKDLTASLSSTYTTSFEEIESNKPIALRECCYCNYFQDLKAQVSTEAIMDADFLITIVSPDTNESVDSEPTFKFKVNKAILAHASSKLSNLIKFRKDLQILCRKWEVAVDFLHYIYCNDHFQLGQINTEDALVLFGLSVCFKIEHLSNKLVRHFLIEDFVDWKQGKHRDVMLRQTDFVRVFFAISPLPPFLSWTTSMPTIATDSSHTLLKASLHSWEKSSWLRFHFWLDALLNEDDLFSLDLSICVFEFQSEHMITAIINCYNNSKDRYTKDQTLFNLIWMLSRKSCTTRKTFPFLQLPFKLLHEFLNKVEFPKNLSFETVKKLKEGRLFPLLKAHKDGNIRTSSPDTMNEEFVTWACFFARVDEFMAQKASIFVARRLEFSQKTKKITNNKNDKPDTDTEDPLEEYQSDED